ncbi:MAG: acyltransferase [Enterococcus sp.]|nr:acyltransferase [Enterococcus sp.]
MSDTTLPNSAGLVGSRKDRKSSTNAERKFRPEVQGLRALAVLMVVTYHIWFDRVSGGVDIFLLISAFLLTLSFTRKAEGGRKLGVLKYWLHTFRRLLPAVVVVIAGTLVATYYFVPKMRWETIFEQGWSSMFYWENWKLAADSVDYYAENSGASPFQHFWSLSVQGQIFILWPLLFLLAYGVAKLLRVRFRTVAIVIFGLLFAGSLAFSIWETHTNQTFAYFDTRARLWEFALGTLIALCLSFISLPRKVGIVAGWVGIAAMLSVGFVIDVEGAFPGFIALWPLAAASLIILSGDTKSKFGVDRVLSWKPLVKMGDVSYALYLWHWPILVIYLIWRGRDEIGIVGGSAVIGLALVLAIITTYLVEKPIRNLKWPETNLFGAVTVIAVCVALISAPLAGWQHYNTAENQRIAAEQAERAARENPGALSLVNNIVPVSNAELLPSLELLGNEWVNTEENCSEGNTPVSDILAKACGQINVREDNTKRIVVVGNSHAQQWTGPLTSLAKDQNWGIVVLYKGGCRFAAGGLGQAPDCDEWNAETLNYILETDTDMVYTVATMSYADNGQDTIVPGFADYANQITAAGIEIVGVRDTPRFSFDMIKCLNDNAGDPVPCTLPRDKTLNNNPPVEELKQSVPGIHFLDFTSLFCVEDSCPPIIGNIYVYMDTNHPTKTYLNSLTTEFAKAFTDLPLKK